MRSMRRLVIVGVSGIVAPGCAFDADGTGLTAGEPMASTGTDEGTTAAASSGPSEPTTAGSGEATSTGAMTTTGLDDTGASDSGEPETSYRREIVISGEQIPGDEPLLDFTVLVAFEGDEGLRHVDQGGHVLEPDGADLVFRDASMQPLAHERLSYQPASGRLAFWVRVPEVAAEGDTIIHLEYGASSLVGQSPTDAWNDAYVAVWHFEDEVEDGGTILDSSSHANHGTAVAMDVADGGHAARVGRGVTFSQDDATIQIGNGALDLPGPLTFEGWGRMDGDLEDNGYQRLFHKGTQSIVPLALWVGDDTVGTRGEVHVAINWEQGESVDMEYRIPDFALGDWHHYAVVVGGRGDEVILFIDGERVQSTTFSDPIETGHPSLQLGNRHPDGPSRRWNGVLDEFRFSDVPRSEAWIEAGFRNVQAPQSFAVVGPEQALP